MPPVTCMLGREIVTDIGVLLAIGGVLGLIAGLAAGGLVGFLAGCLVSQ